MIHLIELATQNAAQITRNESDTNLNLDKLFIAFVLFFGKVFHYTFMDVVFFLFG